MRKSGSKLSLGLRFGWVLGWRSVSTLMVVAIFMKDVSELSFFVLLMLIMEVCIVTADCYCCS